MRLEPATPAHVWRHALARKWRPQEHEYSAVLAQALDGRVWAGVDGDGAVLAIGGCWRLPGEPGRLWLSVAPGLGRRLLPAVRLMRALIADEGRHSHDGVVAYVHDDNMAGRRLAMLLGLDEGEPAGGLRREWVARGA